MTKNSMRELHPERGTFGMAVRWIALGVGLIAVLFLLLWAFGLFTAPMRSASGVLERTMQPDNVIATYERFHDRWKGFENRKLQVRETAALLATETRDSERDRLSIELRAQRQSCRDIASSYNAEAAMTNRAVFQGKEAPYQLNMEECSR